MLYDNNAARLREAVKGLDLMSRFTLAVLALASGVYTYLGVRSLLDGPPQLVFFASIIYSAAVSVAIYAFWSYLMRLLPMMQDAMRRWAMIGVMMLGSVMIVAMSSWLNAAALAGSAALEQHLAVTLEGYVADLNEAHANALSAESLLPDLQRASDRFARLAADERSTGALTGTQGAGSVVQLLTQMSAQLNELQRSILDSRDTVAQLFEDGSAHLEAMRALVSAPGDVQPRSDEFAAEAVALSGVIASLQETSVAASVKRAAADLSLGFIAPVADGNTADLVQRQDQVMATVFTSVQAQSQALTQAADEILSQTQVAPRRFVPLSTAEAVLRYASDFVPSWAGAISIDLLPAVLVLILAVVYSAARRESQALDAADKITAAEMMRSVALFREMTAREASPARPAEPEAPVEPAVPAAPETPAAPAAPTRADDATVTPLEVVKRGRPNPNT